MNGAYIYDAIRSPRTRAKESGGLHDLTPHEQAEVQVKDKPEPAVLRALQAYQKSAAED